MPHPLSARVAVLTVSVGCAFTALPRPAAAASITAGPADYQAKANALAPGDTLHLASGQYGHLSISDLNGTAHQPIVITGPADASAVLNADSCCNTVEITNSSYVVVKDLTIDDKDDGGSFGVSAKGGTNNLVHHITIEDCHILHTGGAQNQDGISTKAPTWGWIIQRNTIIGAGTGLYLGNSDGSDPFIGGIIDDNLIADPIGYCGEIKWQGPRPSVPGIPTTPQVTIIRNNVFIKNDGPSPAGDRPNFLVSGFPDTGPGSQDRYEIYGNFFFHNPREALLQASGRVSVYDNVFVDGQYAAVVLRDHQLPLKEAWVYDNTVYTNGKGIDFGSVASQDELVVGNLVFAGGAPIYGNPSGAHDNVTGMPADAAGVVVAPSMTLGQMDFHPQAGQATGAAVDMTAVAADVDYDVDFDDKPRNFTRRGAYATGGPGWPLGRGIKAVGSAGNGGETDGGAAIIDGGSDTSDGGPRGDGGAGTSPGCSCNAAAGAPGSPGASSAAALALLAALCVRRRRRRRRADVTGRA